MRRDKLINLVKLITRTLYEQKGIVVSLEDVEDMSFAERVVLKFIVFSTDIHHFKVLPHFSIAVDTETNLKNKAEDLEFCKALMDQIAIEVKRIKHEQIKEDLCKAITQSIGLSREALGIKVGK